MLIKIYDDKEQKIVTFYVPDDATKEWVEKNVPLLIRTAQLLAGKIEKTGY